MKSRIKVELDINWIANIEGMTPGEAIEWIVNNIPQHTTLIIEDFYGDVSGKVSYTREETDEEYTARLEKKRKIEENNLRRKREQEESERERVARLELENLALFNYLSKHKGNPHIGDLENLFLSLVRNEKGFMAAQLRECMERLEKETPR